ncbi:MAG: hypothetical protein J6J38_11385 [Lachnospiraceae bacterium]|nr:hypothetical protein [Lachnospiraceae bacterium]
MKKLAKLLVFLLLAGVFAGCTEEVVEVEIPIREYREEEYANKEFKLENDDLIFELDKATTQFTVTQKSTGKVWYSNPVDAANDAVADVVSKRHLQSLLVLEYSNVNELTTTLDTLDHSVTNGNYTLEMPDANTVKVNYSIGKIAKTFIIPPSVPEARMMEFYEKLDRAGQRRVDNAYRKIDINNLLANDDKSELLAKYPDLETTCVYEIRPATKDHMKETLQGLFAEVGYTEEDYRADLEIYAVDSADDKPYYNVSMLYRLDGDKLVVEIPFGEMQFKEEYPITDLIVLPYLGAGSSKEEGFLLVPDGSGAIINFNNGKTGFNNYYAQMYGWDYGMKRDVVVNETRAAFPVFGIAHTDGAMVAMIDEYSSIGTIQAGISGKRHSYNFAYANYEVVHGSRMDISAKSDAAIVSYEKKLPEGSIVQSYKFIEGTTYSDMAKAYREEMLEKYPEMQKTENANAPVSVELIAAVDRVKQVLGMPVTLPEVLTDFKGAQEILNDMAAEGYENLSLRYVGWMNGGLNHSMPKDIDLTSGMGGKKQLQALVDLAKNLGADIYLEGHTQNVYDSGITDGYIKSRDVAKYISREAIEIPEFSKIWFGDINESRLEHHFLLRPSVCMTLMQSLADYSADYGVGVGFVDTGYLLSGDYNQKRPTLREEAMDMQAAKLAEIQTAGTKVSVTAGNDYAIPYVDLVTEMDLYGKGNLLFDAAVPFYQLAFHGLVDYVGNAVNLSGDAWGSVLKAAEYGAGLNFAFYTESADLLQGTEYMDFFGANYDGWKAKAKEYTSRYEKEMAGLNNQYITEHRILAEGVTATVYEDNTVVYVNTTTSAYTDGTVTVPARDYLVERSGK